MYKHKKASLYEMHLQKFCLTFGVHFSFIGGFTFFKIKSAAQILKFLHIFAYDFGAYFH